MKISSLLTENRPNVSIIYLYGRHSFVYYSIPDTYSVVTQERCITFHIVATFMCTTCFGLYFRRVNTGRNMLCACKGNILNYNTPVSCQAEKYVLRILHNTQIQRVDKIQSFNLQAPCVLYIGQAFHYSPENAFYIFNQQIYFII